MTDLVKFAALDGDIILPTDAVELDRRLGFEAREAARKAARNARRKMLAHTRKLGTAPAKRKARPVRRRVCGCADCMAQRDAAIAAAIRQEYAVRPTPQLYRRLGRIVVALVVMVVAVALQNF